MNREDPDAERIDRALSAIFAPPKGLEMRIMDAVKTKAPGWQVPRRVSLWRNPWMRYASVAAAIMVIGCILALAVAKNKAFDDNGQRIAQEELRHLRLNKELPRQNEASRDEARRMPLRLAGVSSPMVSSSGEGRLHVGIAPALRHVWTVPDLSKAEKLLAQIAKVNGKKMVLLEKNHEQVIYSSTLSDIELQSLVNLLHKEQWSLVSPGYPQPLEEYNVVFTGKAVDYELQIVRQQ